MKGDIEKRTEQNNQTKLGHLSPKEQDRLIKAELGRRLKENQLKNIRGLSISEINEIADKEVDPPMQGSRLNKIRHLNMKMGVTEEMLEHSIKSPGEKHLQMLEKSEMLRRYKIREFKKDPVMAQIKRGKLGVDNFFILFGIFGSLMIPVYIFNKFKKHREDIVNSRIASPQVIKRLDEDSPISLDDVSYHTIHYYNPDRIKEEQAKKKRIEERQKLEKQLYF